MVAVGDLIKVWADPPMDPETKEDLKRPFAQFFGQAWDDVMMDAALPLVHHSVWEFYFAVAGLRPVKNLLLPDLTAGKYHPLNLLIG